MFPAYPLLCFNASVAVYLLRGWMEVAYIKATRSPYRVSVMVTPLSLSNSKCSQASQTHIFSNFTFSVVVGSSLISISRIFALWHYYHAPMMASLDFQMVELPRLLNAAGLLPIYPAGTRAEDIPRIDFSLLKDFDLRVCLGKEWHRFTGHYLMPNGIKVGFVKSEFDGMLPRHFEESSTLADVDKSPSFSQKWWSRPETTFVSDDLNDLNKEDPSHHVRVHLLYFYSDVTDDWSFNRFQHLPVTILLTLISLYTLYNPLSSHGIQQWKLHGNVWHATPSLMHATHLCSLVRSGFQVNYGKPGMSSVIIAY